MRKSPERSPDDFASQQDPLTPTGTIEFSTGDRDTAAPPHRLSTTAKTWRLAVVTLSLLALAYGTYNNSDDLFPFGPLAQFATGTDLNGKINSTYIVADTESGQQVRVPLNPEGTGIGRAEVEGQLDRITDDPALLQVIADAYARLHPGADRYTKLYLRRDVTQLRDGRPFGPRETIELATWVVR